MGRLAKYAALVGIFLLLRPYAMLCLGYQVKRLPSSLRPARTLVNRDWIRFDSVRGIRYLPGPVRVQRSYNGEVVFDATSRVNAQGFSSARDYVPSKAPGTFRIVVLGDSYTSASFLGVPWPDRLHDRVKSKNWEVYSFAIDPGSALGWHRIFFEEIVKRYEFDALVIAGYELPPYVGFTSIDSREGKLFLYYTAEPPASLEALRQTGPGLAISSVATDAEMDHAGSPWARFAWVSPTRYLTELLPELWLGKTEIGAPGNRAPAADLSESGTAPDPLFAYWKGLDPKNARAVRDILEYCRTHEKKLMLVPIPHTEKLHAPVAQREPELSAVKRLAETFGGEFADPYPLFEKKSRESVKGFFLRYDAHWNQSGSDLFAEWMQETVEKAWGSSPGSRALTSERR
jgi:hypothetical protein